MRMRVADEQRVRDDQHGLEHAGPDERAGQNREPAARRGDSRPRAHAEAPQLADASIIDNTDSRTRVITSPPCAAPGAATP